MHISHGLNQWYPSMHTQKANGARGCMNCHNIAMVRCTSCKEYQYDCNTTCQTTWGGNHQWACLHCKVNIASYQQAQPKAIKHKAIKPKVKALSTNGGNNHFKGWSK